MSHRLKILLVGNFLSGSGGSRSICEELEMRLGRNGWRTVATSRKAGRIRRLVDMLTTVIWGRGRYDIAVVDVFSGRAFIWAEAVCLALALVHKPFVLTLRGGGLARFASDHPGRVSRLLGSAQAIVTPSRFLATELYRFRGNIRLLPNGLDIAQYRFRSRGELAPRMVWIRAFHRIYAPDMAVRVLAELKKEIPEISLVMVGPDKHDGSLAKTVRLAADLQVANRMSVVGPVTKDQVPHWLGAGDVFLNTTNVESFGVSVMEAAACGLPIVSTNVGELSYLWNDGLDALLVEPGDYQAMAEAVNRLLHDSALARRLSCNGRERAERIDWSVVLPQWETLFEDAVGA